MARETKKISNPAKEEELLSAKRNGKRVSGGRFRAAVTSSHVPALRTGEGKKRRKNGASRGGRSDSRGKTARKTRALTEPESTV